MRERCRISSQVVAGHLLFSFAAAARWHDSMYVVALEASMAGDISLLEALTSKHKSSRGKEQQMELLPFTALGRITTDDFGVAAGLKPDRNPRQKAESFSELLVRERSLLGGFKDVDC